MGKLTGRLSTAPLAKNQPSLSCRGSVVVDKMARRLSKRPLKSTIPKFVRRNPKITWFFLVTWFFFCKWTKWRVGCQDVHLQNTPIGPLEGFFCGGQIGGAAVNSSTWKNNSFGHVIFFLQVDKMTGGLSRRPLAKCPDQACWGCFFASGQNDAAAVNTSTCTLPRLGLYSPIQNSLQMNALTTTSPFCPLTK